MLATNETARNSSHGIDIENSPNVHFIGNFVEGNDGSGIKFAAWMDGLMMSFAGIYERKE